MKLAPLAGAVLAVLPISSAVAEMFVPSIFTDHMVVQQKKPLSVFGKDAPGQKITVSFADRLATATTDASGKWRVLIAPPLAGGPYEVAISGSKTLTFSDVLVGEVWLCSGQSNMQFSIENSINGAEEMASADYPHIRLYNVPLVRNGEPQDDIEARWQVCSPKTINGFSAVGYFFGRQLQHDLKVPIGLINSSWGGSHAEAWTPREELLTLSGMQAQVDRKIEDILPLWREYGPVLDKWMKSAGVVNEGGEKEHDGWAKLSFDDSKWQTLALPTMWQDVGVPGNGIMWFRKIIEIPEGMDVTRNAMLELGGIDDLDTTFVNGKQVGRTGGDTPSFHVAARQYAVPQGVLKPGKNVIAVRVIDLGGNGGFTGPAMAMKLAAGEWQMPLSGEWKHAWEKEMTFPSGRPNSPDTGDIMITELYNAMIHPFEGYPIAGAIWYQGESNVGKMQAYTQLLPTMIEAWRQRWDDNFTFLIVQLAGFQSDNGKPDDAPEWAAFREIQREIASTVPNAGLAVAIDIGDNTDIHPRNKQDVGRRLALQALKVTYEMDVVASGPTFAAAKVDGKKVTLSFDNVGGGLVAKEDSLANNFALQDKNGDWAWANARIVGDTVELSSPKISAPVKVRYAWQNSPPASLYNKAGLPAVPFSAEIKP